MQPQGEAHRRRRRWSGLQKDKLFREFNEWGYDAKGWSRNTRYRYELRVRAADAWLIENRHVSVLHARPKDLQAFLFDQTPHAGNRNNIRQALIGFGEFLVEIGLQDFNNALALPRLPVPRTLPKALDVKPAHRMEVAASREEPMVELIILLMLYQGMRREEVAALKWSEVDGDWLHFQGKGSKDRRIPLMPPVAKVMRKWRQACKDPVWVFPSPRPSGRSRHVCGEFIRRRVKDVAEIAGVDKIHPHVLRHTAATRMLEIGGDIRAVQEYLGHASLATTTIYLKVRPAHLEEIGNEMNYEEDA